MLTLIDDPQETLTANLWEHWKTAGYTDQPYALTWVEVNNIVKFYLKLCKQQNIDYRELDFENLLDHKLTYYENVAVLENAISYPEEKQSQEALSELNSKLESDYGITVTKNFKPKYELEDTNRELKKTLETVKETLCLSEKQKQAITQELEELKIKFEKSLKEAIAAPVENVQIKATSTKKTHHRLRETKDFLSDLYWCLLK